MSYKFTKLSGGSSVEIVQTVGNREDAVMSQKATSQSFANAFKGSESGNVVALKDVSPIEHSLDVKVLSKNLIPYPYSMWYNVGDITFVGNEDGTVTVNGASSSVHYYAGIVNESAAYPNSFCIDAGTYTLSTGFDSGGSEIVRIMYRDPETKAHILSVDAYTSTSFTIDRTVEVYRVLLVVNQDNRFYSDFVFKPMLEKGIKATNYTPYIADDTEITIKSLGKNVLTPISGYDSFVHYGNPFTTAGITYTLLEDGRIHLQGTVTGFSMCYFFGTYVPFGDFLIDGATYSISSNIEGNPSSAFLLIGTIIDKTTGLNTYISDSNNKFTVDKSKYTYDMFRIQATNVDDEVDAIVGVQLEIGDTTTEYEPYKEYETIITAIGEGAELTSVAPNMTITTDNEGAIIECSYNKDTNKAIEKLTQAIISLGGNI